MGNLTIAVLEHLQGIVDGYFYRLPEEEGFRIVGVARFGEELEGLLANAQPQVLLLEPGVPTSKTNRNCFPLWPTLDQVFKKQPGLRALAISGKKDAETVQQALLHGLSGYIFKDDAEAIRSLSSIVRSVAAGGLHFSKPAHEILLNPTERDNILTERQLQALSLCAAYPDDTMQQLAQRMGIAASTLRSTLSTAYRQLDTHSRMAAVEEARRRGWIT